MSDISDREIGEVVQQVKTLLEVSQNQRQDFQVMGIGYIITPMMRWSL